MSKQIQVLIQKLDEDATIPLRMNPGDAGFDLYSDEDMCIKAYDRELVHTGIALQIPRGYEGCVRPRSGNALKKGYTVLNTPGTIDSGYRGEICVLLYNSTNKDIYISPGDRIAQLVIQKLPDVVFKEVTKLRSTKRGLGGFGSTD